MAHSVDVEERIEVVELLHSNFVDIQDKELAWKDLLALTKDEDSLVRSKASDALDSAFVHMPDKEQALKYLLALTKDVKDVLDSAFAHITDKEQAWKKLLALTKDEDSLVRFHAAYALGSVFTHVTDKEQAWNDLLTLTMDMHSSVRVGVAYALGFAFPHVTNKEQAWNDLLALAKNGDSRVRRGIANTLGFAFPHVTNKEQAWNDLLALAKNGDSRVRRDIANTLGFAFPHVTNKEQATESLVALTKDKDSRVRRDAAYALGSAFPHVTNKEQATESLVALTKDVDKDVRVFTNYSLGRVSVFKATEAQSKEDYSKELKKSIEYFERSSNEVATSLFLNPARFCHPFYKLFYSIIFEEQDAEAGSKKYLNEAKRAVGSSESEEKLLKVVENLSNALSKAQKAREMGLDIMKYDLNAFRLSFEESANLLYTTHEKAPAATEVIIRGLPIIDEKIKGIIAEIRQKTKTFCKQTNGTQLEYLGKEINRNGEALLQIRDPIGLEKGMNYMQITLSAICAKMPGKERGEACELVEKISDELFIEDKVYLVNIILSEFLSNIQMLKEYEKLGKKLVEVNEGVHRIERKTDIIIDKIEISCDRIIYDLEKGGVKLKDEDKEQLRTLANDLKRANKEQLSNFSNELIRLLKDFDVQRQIESEAPKGLKSKVKKRFSIINGILNELGIALSAAVTAEEILPHIEAIMHEITILSGITPGVASTLLLIPLIVLKIKTIE